MPETCAPPHCGRRSEPHRHVERYPLLLPAGGPGAGLPCRRSAALSGRPAAPAADLEPRSPGARRPPGRLPVYRGFSEAAVRPGPAAPRPAGRDPQPFPAAAAAAVAARLAGQLLHRRHAFTRISSITGSRGGSARKVRARKRCGASARITTRPSGWSACRAGPPASIVERLRGATGESAGDPARRQSQEADLAPTDHAAPPALDPLRLGFVGKDWRRKGLPFLLQVAEELE